jgi:hypothetical protein
MTKRKTIARKKPIKPAGSEIIRQCVVHAQSVAAFKAGYAVDLSGDFDFAGVGKGQLGLAPASLADHALRRLVALSPEGNKRLSTAELFAKAKVLSLVMEAEGGNTRSLEPDETAFVRFFAREVEAYCRHAEQAKEEIRAENGFIRAALQTVAERQAARVKAS